MSSRTYQTSFTNEAFAIALVARRTRSAIFEFLRLVHQRAAEHFAHQRRYQQLLGMSARQLQDIGLSPSDLSAIADGSYFYDATRRHRYGEYRNVLRTTVGLYARV